MNPPTEDKLGEGKVGSLMLSDILNAQYKGTQGETVFFEPYVNILDHKAQLESRDIFSRLGAFKDDRSMALVAALVCEAYIDRLLSAVMPGYNEEFEEDANFTFSMKIKVLRALGIIPQFLTKAADLVREVRNKFAHNLNLDSLENVPQKVRDRLRTFAQTRGAPGMNLTDIRQTYDFAVGCATSSIASYFVNTVDFNSTVRAPIFEQTLNQINQTRRKAHIDVLLQHMTGPAPNDSSGESLF